MPKRCAQEKIEHYNRKIRKLGEKQKRKRIRRNVISTDSDEISDNEPRVSSEVVIPAATPPETAANLPEAETSNQDASETVQDSTIVPELDSEILIALGEATDDSPKYGENIHDNLARLWQPILKKGLNKESKDKLLKQYLIPANCTLLKAPKLNPEIAAAVSDAVRGRDKRVEAVQDQLALGLTALNRGLSILLDNDQDKLQAIKLISDSCRILCDLHFVETQARTKFVTVGLEKSFLKVIQDVDRDEMLFGSSLPEKIKASKAIEKQGLQIKKSSPIVKTQTPASQQSSSRTASQGNWVAPPRYPSNRGGRGGGKKE
ncbi:uncharacterized protein LOC131843593 [Achroia grisella]|uniref:uncharacterized protein LOC131843593 n=1 Tax=Achroia grisella TaxID=688607 RepID=UPI0027D2D836|nr:uncharacterized protein LOC131843593 [Achroia grisella]